MKTRILRSSRALNRDRSIGRKFDHMSVLYDEVRPNYPADMIKRITGFARIDQESKILDVGCGSGKATLSFAEIGCNVTALDIGRNLIALARKKMRAFRNVRYVVDSFEDVNLPANYFNLLISGNAFHWVDPKTGFAKAATVLGQDGIIALFWNKENYERTDFIPGILDFYEKYSPGSGKVQDERIDEAKFNIERTSKFRPVERHIYLRELTYNKEDYVKLVRTFSWVNSHPKKEELLRDLRILLEAQGELVIVPYTTILLITRRY